MAWGEQGADQQVQTDRDGRFNLLQLCLFSMPVIVFQAIELPWRVYLPAFFSQTLGLPLAMVGLAGVLILARGQQHTPRFSALT